MIDLIAKILTAFIALEHFYILWIEMFAWETKGKKTFNIIPEELFSPTKNMAANQGLYNGFLATGLLWSFFITDINWQANIRIFFIGCVIVAGIYGALTITKKIFFLQALPAIIAMIFVLFSHFGK